MSRAEFAYVQARLHARHGARPTPGAWSLLAASKDLGHCLQAARGTPLQEWVEHLSGRADAHLIERSLRARWRAYTGAVASWSPEPWRRAVRWQGTAMDLPVVAAALAESDVLGWLSWVREDPELRHFAPGDRTSREAALPESRWAPVVFAWRAGADLVDAWSAHWRCLWPGCGTAERAALGELSQMLLVHRRRMAAAGDAVGEGARLRTELERALVRTFRRRV